MFIEKLRAKTGLIVAMQKLLLKNMQEVRDHPSVLFDTPLGAADRTAVGASPAPGKYYNELTKSQLGHTCGPLYLWIFGAWLQDILRQLQTEESRNKAAFLGKVKETCAQLEQ